jgi:2-oxoisovalerate dehydrogenase E1 component alpha subunit
LVTYRCDAHSTSDDTTQYRATGEAECWPGGDPIERLKRHLVGVGEWSDDAHVQLDKALEQEVMATFEHAEAYGSLAHASDQPAAMMFEDVYATMPDHLRRQYEELQAESADEEHESPTVPFVSAQHRAVG